MRILVVEDEPEMGELLSNWLVSQGFECEVANNGTDGMIAFSSGTFTAAAIDVMLPGMSGFELCRRIRETGSNVPLVLITARDAIDDRVRGLDSGADDYIIKPFDFAELGARLRALFRRDAAGQKTLVSVAGLELDSMTSEVRVAGRRVVVSPKEFTVLRLLAQNPGTVVARDTMLLEVWGSTEFIHPNIVEQYVSFLRKKIDPSAAGVSIRTVRGVGYALDPHA